MHVIAPKEPVPIRFDAFGFGDAPCRLLRVNSVHRRASVYRACFDVRHKTAGRCWMGKHAKMPKSLTLAAVWEHMKDKEGKEG